MTRAVANPVSFDPHATGIAETIWTSVLQSAPWWDPNEGPITVLSPHPDDEVFGAGGLMSQMASTHDVRVICVTDGERAYEIAGDLAATRRDELRQAISCLAATIRIIRLGLPDGDVTKCESQLRTALFDHIPEHGTLVVPFEEDGHPDHEAVGTLGREIGAILKLKVLRYPIWRWHHGSVKGMSDLRWVKFKLSECARTAKARAAQCFQSQLAPTHAPAIVPAHVLAYFQRPYEAFIS